jgi:hypothetical protein
MLAQCVAHGIAQKNVYEWVDGLKCGGTTYDDDDDDDDDERSAEI